MTHKDSGITSVTVSALGREVTLKDGDFSKANDLLRDVAHRALNNQTDEGESNVHVKGITGGDVVAAINSNLKEAQWLIGKGEFSAGKEKIDHGRHLLVQLMCGEIDFSKPEAKPVEDEE